MKKFKLFFNTINEQKWINEQLKNGYRLKKISLLGTYHFEKTTEQQIVQIDYQDYKSKQNYEHTILSATSGYFTAILPFA